MGRASFVEVQFWYSYPRGSGSILGYYGRTILRIKDPGLWLASAARRIASLEAKSTAIADRAFGSRNLAAKLWYCYHRFLIRQRAALLSAARMRVKYLVLNAHDAITIHVSGDEYQAVSTHQRYTLTERLDVATDVFLSARAPAA